MRLYFVFSTLVGLSIGSLAPASAADEIVVANRSDQPLNLWMWPRELSKWSDPVFMRRSGSIRISLKNRGEYYLAIRDMEGNEAHLNWYNLRKLTIDFPDVVVSINAQYRKEEKEQTISVPESVVEQRIVIEKREQLVEVRYPDGTVRYEKRVVDVQVPIQVQVTRMRQVISKIQVTVFVANATAASDGKAIDLSKYVVSKKP